MNYHDLYDILVNCDKLTNKEFKDLEFVEDRIAVHLENCGFEVVNTKELAQQVMLLRMTN